MRLAVCASLLVCFFARPLTAQGGCGSVAATCGTPCGATCTAGCLQIAGYACASPCAGANAVLPASAGKYTHSGEPCASATVALAQPGATLAAWGMTNCPTASTQQCAPSSGVEATGMLYASIAASVVSAYVTTGGNCFWSTVGCTVGCALKSQVNPTATSYISFCQSTVGYARIFLGAYTRYRDAASQPSPADTLSWCNRTAGYACSAGSRFPALAAFPMVAVANLLLWQQGPLESSANNNSAFCGVIKSNAATNRAQMWDDLVVSARACAPGYYRDAASGRCLPCPAGSFCTGGNITSPSTPAAVACTCPALCVGTGRAADAGACPSATPTRTASLSGAPTQTPSGTPSPSAPPIPVWSFPIDQTTGIAGFTVANAAGLAYVPDRNGCPGSAMALLNAYLTGDVPVPPAVPTGAAPRSASAWVKCAPTAINSVVFEWGLNVNHQRSSLLAYLGAAPVAGVAFVGYGNDAGSPALSGCTGAWTWVAYSVNGTHKLVFRNGTLVAVAPLAAPLNTIVTPMRIAWNGKLSHNNGELFATVVANALDDLRVYNLALSPSSATQLFQLSLAATACPSVSPSPLPVSASPTPAPIPAPVWSFAVDQTTGLLGFTATVQPAGSLVWVPDRNGCAGSALQFRNAYLMGTSTPPAAQQPLGGSSRTIAAWVRCTTGNAAAQNVISWGAQANNQRSALLSYFSGGFGFVGFNNDVPASGFFACNGFWTWIAASYGGASVSLFRNGSLIRVTSVSGLATTATPYGVAWNGLFSHVQGELFAVNANNSLDDLRVWNVSLTTQMVAAVYASFAGGGCPSPSAAPTPSGTLTASGTGSNTPSKTPSASGTATATLSPGASISTTPSGTVAPSGTALTTGSGTANATASGTANSTISPSFSSTAASSGTASQPAASLADSSSATLAPASPAASIPSSATASLSFGTSASPSAAATVSASQASSPTSTATASLGAGASASQSAAATVSASQASSPTSAATASLSTGASASTSAAATVSASQASSPTSGATASLSTGASASTSAVATVSTSSAVTVAQTAFLSRGASASTSPVATAAAAATEASATAASPAAASLGAAVTSASPGAGSAVAAAPSSGIAGIAGGAAGALLLLAATAAILAARRRRRGGSALASAAAKGGADEPALAPAARGGGSGGGGGGGGAALADEGGAMNPLARRGAGAAGSGRAVGLQPLQVGAGLAAVTQSGGGGAAAAAVAAPPRAVAVLGGEVSARALGIKRSLAASSAARAGAGSGSDDGAVAAPAASQAALPGEPLPAGWSEHYSRSRQKTYYRHADTGDTAWERPRGSTASGAAPAGLPAGWSSAVEEASGATFFIAPDGSTTWTAPLAEQLPPGWSATQDDASGEYYYTSPDGASTTWERPASA